MGDADLNLYVTEAPKFTVFRFDIEFDQIPCNEFFVVSFCTSLLSLWGNMHAHMSMIYPLQYTFHSHSVLCLIKLYIYDSVTY